jgi:TctA family transporter
VACCGIRKKSQKVTLPHTRRVLVNQHGPNQAIEIHCLDNQNFVQGVAGAAAAAADVQEFLPTVTSAVAAVQALADSVTDEDILTGEQLFICLVFIRVL